MALVINPWKALPEREPYVLTDDAAYVEAFNATELDPVHRIDLTLPAVPFLGPHQAPVVVLLANPGRDPQDDEGWRRPGVLSAHLDALSSDAGAPIRWLDDDLADTPGGAWIRRSLKGLLAPGTTFADLGRRLLMVDFHGYHSEKWSCPPVTLPSQHYGFDLVRRAMQRDAMIIVNRAVRYWYVAVPDLAKHAHATHTARSSAISLGNLGEEQFRAVERKLWE